MTAVTEIVRATQGPAGPAGAAGASGATGPTGPDSPVFAHREITATGTTAGLITDYDVSFTNTTSPCVYQAIAMGVVAGQRRVLMISDETPATTTPKGFALAHAITLLPLSGKKLDGVVDGPLVILNGGGVISVRIDEFDNMRTLGFSP